MASKAEEAAHEATHHASSNKGIALFISVLALFLAISETLGKSAQTAALSDNVEASNLWAFFQAKTIRMTALRVAAESREVDFAVADPAIKAAIRKQIDAWKETAARYDSEPDTQEGRKELAARAKHAEEKRDKSMAMYHHFEISSAVFQIGIVLASASIIANLMALVWAGAGLGLVGLALMAFGQFAPTALPFLGGH